MFIRPGVLASLLLLCPFVTAAAQTHFDSCSSSTGSNATVLVDPAISPQFAGAQPGAGDEIAVLNASGLCTGASLWTGSVIAITVWGDDPFTTEVDGMVGGEEMVFAVWDASAGRQYGAGSGSVSVTYSAVPPYRAQGTYLPDAIYNLLSLNAEPPNLPPVASISASATDGMVPLTVNFNAGGSTDADGSIVGYAWDFGDGSGASGAAVSHLFETEGTFLVTLTVTDDDGATAIATASIKAASPQNNPPTAAFTATPQTGPAPLVVAVDGSPSTDPEGPIASYTWDFGNGSNGTGASTSHTYATPGTYQLRLTVLDADGAAATASRQITVQETPNVAPVASFTLSPSSGVAPLQVAVDAGNASDVDGTITDYAWDFGDGSVASGVSATHTYTQVGNYTVRLTVTDDDGANDETTRSVTVTSPANTPPVASFAVSATNGVAPLAVSFDGSASSDADGSVSSYAWEFGDGGQATGATVSHTFQNPGTYEVRLTVLDDDGASASATRTIVASQPPSASGLVLHFDFEEASGTTVVDRSGRGHNGAIIGNATRDANGVFGSALRFPGSGARVSVADHVDINDFEMGERTISLWFRVDDRFVSTRKQIVYEEGGATRGLGIYVFDGLLYVGGWNSPVEESGWTGSFIATGGLRSGAWHHAAVVLDGTASIAPGSLRGYLDGVEFGAREGSQVWPHLDDIGIGAAAEWTLFHDGPADPAVDNSLVGAIDELKLYNDVLTAGQIAAIFEESGELQNQAPTARMDVSPPGGQAPATLIFDATTSSDPDNNITVYRWDFGDGGNATGSVVTHTYTSAGSYTARLTVVDSDGLQSVASQTIVIAAPSPSNQAPVARFTIADVPDQPFSRRFDASGSTDADGSVARYVWDFGDGTSGQEATPTHAFPGAGIYVVNLTVVDDDGATDTQQSQVEIRQVLPLELEVSAVGPVAFAGTVVFADGRWTIDAPGGAVDDPRTDAFGFVHRVVAGDEQMIVRVDSIENTDRWAYAGVMFRSALVADAPHVAMTVTPESGPVFAYRMVDGGWEVKSQAALVSTPLWLRIRRTGNRFVGQYSVDGLVWTEVGTQTVEMAETVHAGIVASSNTADQQATVVLSELAFGEQESIEVPDFVLSPAYPNPFSGRATFSLSVAESQNVFIAAYNILGEQVAILHDGILVQETTHEFELDASRLASGMYLIHVYGDGFRQTIKATLVR